MLKVIFYYNKMNIYKVHGSGQGAVSNELGDSFSFLLHQGRDSTGRVR